MKIYARRARLPLIAALAGLLHGGCVFENIRDIRDDLRVTNDQLDRTEQLLTQLETVNPKLADLQAQIDSTRARLETIQSIDESLAAMNATLQSVDRSLASLDLHLASLRKTLENIDSTIPFLKFADPAQDEQTEETLPPDAEPAGNSATPPGQK